MPTMAGHKTASGGGRAPLPGVGREQGALKALDFRWGAEMATMRQAGNSLLRERGRSGHSGARGLLFPAFSIWPMAPFRLPALPGCGSRGSHCHGSRTRGGVKRRLAFQVRAQTLQAFGLESMACGCFGWGFCFISGFPLLEPLGRNAGANSPGILNSPEKIRAP